MTLDDVYAVLTVIQMDVAAVRSGLSLLASHSDMMILFAGVGLLCGIVVGALAVLIIRGWFHDRD